MHRDADVIGLGKMWMSGIFSTPAWLYHVARVEILVQNCGPQCVPQMSRSPRTLLSKQVQVLCPIQYPLRSTAYHGKELHPKPAIVFKVLWALTICGKPGPGIENISIFSTTWTKVTKGEWRKWIQLIERNRARHWVMKASTDKSQTCNAHLCVTPLEPPLSQMCSGTSFP